MLASVHSATLLGVDGHDVRVEVHVSQGLPAFTVVGLPDTSCREARDRVRAALLSSNLPWPTRRVTVNLAPPTLRKSGSSLDLAIAVALLEATEVLPAGASAGLAFIAELGLDGSLRPVPGMISLVDAASAPAVVVPAASHTEAAYVAGCRVRAATSLVEVVAALSGDAPWPEPPTPRPPEPGPPPPDLSDVRGQPFARFALEVAAAGAHHLLMTGPPGSGKTMLARRLPGILPPLGGDEALETSRIHSAAGSSLSSGLITTPPLRAPHHGASAVALIGGGSTWMRPGEVSLAANGVLFLDELGEFSGHVLDHLRQPLEEGVVRISRARATVTFPARFLLVAAMNPCPCGSGSTGGCRCSEAARARYARRLSGPLLDRFDLRVGVHRPDVDDLMAAPGGESSAVVAARVTAARGRARERGVVTNSRLPSRDLDRWAPLSSAAQRILEFRLRAGGLSARGLHRIRRVARTIADLEDSDGVDEGHVCAALELRCDPAALLVA